MPIDPRRLAPLAALALCLSPASLADGPADNVADKVRPIPPPGILVEAADRRHLTAGAAWLGAEIESLRRELAAKPPLLARLPDVQIFHKAVDWALRYEEFHATNEVAAARAQLAEAFERIASLRAGKTPWLNESGPVALGYVSEIDGSIQPYGVVVPATFDPTHPRKHRLDFWFHGRGEKLSELAFVQDRQNRPGEFTPPDAFVLHPYGRYCNGARFAGETDAWEAYADLAKRYPIDEQRLVVRGFSLGGASCWHFAVHHASRWAAAAPGAGFSETAEFLRVFQSETLKPYWWEVKLWRLHDATRHALNLRLVPTIAYSGENDRQIQAAQAMEKAATAEGIQLAHLIGPGTGHSYHPATKAELNRRIDLLAAKGRDPLPRNVRFVTHTLRYPTQAWITLDALGAHWEPARVEATLETEASLVSLTTSNVTALTLDLPPDAAQLDPDRPFLVEIDGTRLEAGRPASDRSWTASLVRENGNGAWKLGKLPADEIRKRPGLQGPIDDAFMAPFLFVRPTGTPLNLAVGRWASAELARAMEHWRRHYRGEVRIKDDTAVTEADLAAYHVVLWGDPQSNALLRKIADRLTIRWDAKGVHLPGQDFPSDGFVPVLVQPNPLSPRRYVVVNSGFTFREYDYLNNARQTPKLPDWAVVDLSVPPGTRFAGRIATAGFFGEKWEWQNPPE